MRHAMPCHDAVLCCVCCGGVQVAGSKPVVTWNIELDTLRGDLGLVSFPPKELHYRYLGGGVGSEDRGEAVVTAHMCSLLPFTSCYPS